MSTTGQATWNDWIGADVVDLNGDKIGTLDGVYMDRGTGQPEWLAVTTGLFGRNQSFVPLTDTDSVDGALKIPFDKDVVKDAPNVDPDQGHLTPEDEDRLYRHYGRSDYRAWSDEDSDLRDWGDTGTDVSGPETDSAITRSEEEVAVGTRQVEAGRVRLRKYVVTEDVTTTVPVRKEKLRIEREPITEDNIDAALSGSEISEEDHEIVLNEEEVVVDKRVVPKERVRAEKDVEIDEQSVTESVRKEQIEVDEGGDAR